MLCYLSLTFRSKLDIVTNLRKKKKTSQESWICLWYLCGKEMQKYPLWRQQTNMKNLNQSSMIKNKKRIFSVFPKTKHYIIFHFHFCRIFSDDTVSDTVTSASLHFYFFLRKYSVEGVHQRYTIETFVSETFRLQLCTVYYHNISFA